MNGSNPLIPAETIERRILLVRGHRMMLDEHLAELYGVETKALKRAVRRNRDRFPADFMFELRAQEYAALRRQFGTLKRGQHAKYLPYAFTEQGVAMLSSVLRSKRAVLVNVEIMRAFVRLREILATHRQLAGKLAELERRMATHDEQIQAIFEAIRQLLNAPEPPRGRIGFQAREPRARYRIRAKRAHR